MSDKLEACAECSQMCHVIHQSNRDPSSIVTSFFKVMFGANYNDVLFLPPKFARSVPDLIGQEAQLEDSCGDRWTVTVSNVEDSLAFHKGWNAFSIDHRLKMGEILVFHYINRSHFFVQIYGASGCPKYRRVKDNGNLRKKTRAEGDFVAKDGPSYMNDNELGSNGSMGSKTFSISQHHTASTSNTLDFDSDIGRLPIVSKTRQYEEPLCMIVRDDGCIEGEYRSSLYDLSKYEISIGVEKSSDRGSTMPEFPIEADMLNNDPVNLSVDVLGTYVEKPAEKGKNCMTMPEEDAICQKAEKPIATHPTNLLLMEEAISVGGEGSSHQDNTIMKSPAEAYMFDKDPVKLSRHVLERFAAKTAESGKKTLQVPEKATRQNADKRSKPHPTVTMKVTKKEPAEMSDTHIREDMLHGNGEKGIKEGSHTFGLPTKDDVVFEVVKEEPIDFDDMPLPDDANASCLVVVGSEQYLELPTNFSSLVSRRSRTDRKVVFLRGPDRRLWAVLYIQKFGIKILNSRWQVFCKANGVQPRDECLFRRESDDSECIFRVSVLNRQVGGT